MLRSFKYLPEYARKYSVFNCVINYTLSIHLKYYQVSKQHVYFNYMHEYYCYVYAIYLDFVDR